jgi:hypothetical protein
MRDAVPQNIDLLRRGMSYSAEVGLLTSLHLGPKPTGIVVPAPGAERRRLVDQLRRDLFDAAVRPGLHPEWSRALASELPSDLRSSWARQDITTETNPWLARHIPAISARLARESRPELSSFALFGVERQAAIARSLTDTVLAVYLTGLSGRERLTTLSALGDEAASRLESIPETRSAKLEPEARADLRALMRRGLSRSSRSAKDTRHLFRRLTAFVLARTFGHEYRFEVRAVAMAWPRPDGRRLLRYVEREPQGNRYLRALIVALCNE